MKRHLHRHPLIGSAVAVALAAVVGAAHAQAPAASWPSKPMHIVVPYPPGGSTDTLTRRVAQRLSLNLGQQVVVENRPGAGGMMGTEQVSRATPDGYTLVLGNNATHGLTQLLSKRKVLDPIHDFTPLTLVAMMPLALAVHPSVSANNAAELVAWAKANPGKASYGTAGLGTPHHVAGEMLSQMAGGTMIHVPYKGSGQSVSDLIGGQIQMAFAALATVLPHANNGKVKIIGLVEAERQKSAPNIPTLGESLPGYAMPRTWLGYFGPANMPPALSARVSAELVKAINDPEVAAYINGSGLQVLTSSQDEFTRMIRDDMARLSKLVKSANISME